MTRYIFCHWWMVLPYLLSASLTVSLLSYLLLVLLNSHCVSSDAAVHCPHVDGLSPTRWCCHKYSPVAISPYDWVTSLCGRICCHCCTSPPWIEFFSQIVSPYSYLPHSPPPPFNDRKHHGSNKAISMLYREAFWLDCCSILDSCYIGIWSLPKESCWTLQTQWKEKWIWIEY